MKNKFKKVIVTTVSVLSIGVLPLSEPMTPAPYHTEPYESESGEEPGSGNGCVPLNDEPEIDYTKD